MNSYTPPAHYPSSMKRELPHGEISRENIRPMAKFRGFKLRVQPDHPGLWRLQYRKCGAFLIQYRTLAQIRALLLTLKTEHHKLRERIYKTELKPHPWTATE